MQIEAKALFLLLSALARPRTRTHIRDAEVEDAFIIEFPTFHVLFRVLHHIDT